MITMRSWKPDKCTMGRTLVRHGPIWTVLMVNGVRTGLNYSEVQSVPAQAPYFETSKSTLRK